MNIKTLLLFVLYFGIHGSTAAQFKLSGKIEHYTGKEKLQVNIPEVFGFYKENSVDITIAKDGTYQLNLPIRSQKFVNLIFQRKFYSLLLHPKKDLKLVLNEKDSTLKLIAGTALAENKLMQQIDLEEYPFFLKDDAEKRYATLSLAELKESVIVPYAQQRDVKIRKVAASNLPAVDKAAISAEINYISYNYLDDLARTTLRNKKVIDSLIIYLADHIDPNPAAFPAGPQYYAFADRYIRALETKAFFKVGPNQFKPTDTIAYYGITMDSAQKVVKKYGKPYWRWIGSVKNLPLKVVEPYTYQALLSQFRDKDLKQASALAAAFKLQFPNSRYQPEIDSKLAGLVGMLAANDANEKIKIFAGYEKLTSIYDIIKTLKGKMVYLDIWGTWCGPCKEELRYTPALKTRFANKDIVFLYLDMDEDDKELDWRNFIKVNSLTGIHLRKSRTDIAVIWKELLANADDKAEYYPQYFIFDPTGKLVVTKAKRPSETKELYAQLESFLPQAKNADLK
jgi:thiol-disulfide isomerase/thioredoxin